MGRRLVGPRTPDGERPPAEVAVLPVHFEDRSGTEFARLCFAYLLRAFDWTTINWYGQLGGDAGRDIWGVRKTGEAECFQCANHARLKFKKAEEDLAKLMAGPNGLPMKFRLITGWQGVGRDAGPGHRPRQEAKLGIREAEVWSGPEFEERLRRDEPLLIRRFVEGVPFPESVDGLRAMSLDGEVGDDEPWPSWRSASTGRRSRPSSGTRAAIPDFKKAITDTIEALNTAGQHQEVEGHPHRHAPGREAGAAGARRPRGRARG
jgi:hypothetical protein